MKSKSKESNHKSRSATKTAKRKSKSNRRKKRRRSWPIINIIIKRKWTNLCSSNRMPSKWQQNWKSKWRCQRHSTSHSFRISRQISKHFNSNNFNNQATKSKQKEKEICNKYMTNPSRVDSLTFIKARAPNTNLVTTSATRTTRYPSSQIAWPSKFHLQQRRKAYKTRSAWSINSSTKIKTCLTLKTKTNYRKSIANQMMKILKNCSILK